MYRGLGAEPPGLCRGLGEDATTGRNGWRFCGDVDGAVVLQ